MCEGTTQTGIRCRRKAEPFCTQHEPVTVSELWGRNRSAVEATLLALAEPKFDGVISAVDAATVELVRSLADVVDWAPGNAQMWREYANAVRGLVPVNVSANSGDKLMAELRATVGDSSSAGSADDGGA